jgi:putative DNA primase/helicase
MVAFEQKNKTPFFGPNTAKLIFGCNGVPPLYDQTNATWNRLIILPFRYVVPRGEQNPLLVSEEHWADELPGILNWALDGLDRYRASGRLTAADLVHDAVARHRQDSDPARRFLTENYREPSDADGEAFVVADIMYETYKGWFEQHGYDERKFFLNSISFGKVVHQIFPKAVSKPKRVGSKVRRVWENIRDVRADDVTTE